MIVAGRLIVAVAPQSSDAVYELSSGGEQMVVRFTEAGAGGLSWLKPLPVAPTLEFFEDGDLVAVEGTMNAVGTLEVSKILLLAPSDRSVELPTSEFTVGRGVSWSRFLQEVRGYFLNASFIEATTPTLVPSPGTEPFLDPFLTTWEIGSMNREFYLPTSPEFHLKQLLVRGFTKIFEIKPCFRNGEISPHHQPEFLMLEWYRAYSNLDAIADDVEGLFAHLGAKFNVQLPRLARVTIPELFAEAFPGFVLKPDSTRDDLADLAKSSGVEFSSSDSFDDLFFRLFLERIESNLGHSGPLLVSLYPPSQAALSRIGPHGFAERFEVYWKGLELANAFHELNNPAENEARFNDDARKKLELGKPAVPRDENLVRAFHYGMPPSGGIALGIERLFMALMGVDKIEDARAFPIVQHK